MKLRVNRYSYPVTVLGFGRRVSLWVQGCEIGCKGCSSTDTWDENAGELVEPRDLADRFVDVIIGNDLDGITLTGGEPSDQSEALSELVTLVRDGLVARGRAECDVLLFTGRSGKASQRMAPELWAVVDAAVCGPYRHDLPSKQPLLASANQELILVSDLGVERYESYTSVSGPHVQASLAHGHLSLIGLPQPGDLPRLREALEKRGVVLEGVSWQNS